MRKALFLVVIQTVCLLAQLPEPGSSTSTNGASTALSDCGTPCSGGVKMNGLTSGSLAIAVPDVAGTAAIAQLPTDTATATVGKVLAIKTGSCATGTVPASWTGTCVPLEWLTPSTYTVPSFATGSFIITPAMIPTCIGCSVSGVSMTAGTAYCANTISPYSEALTKVGYYATGGASASNGIVIAVYDSSWNRLYQKAFISWTGQPGSDDVSYTFTGQVLNRICIASEGGTFSPRSIVDIPASHTITSYVGVFYSKAAQTSGTGTSLSLPTTITSPTVLTSGGFPLLTLN